MTRRRRILAAAAAIAVATGCGGDDGAAGRGTTVVPDASDDFTPAAIEWRDCEDLECAVVEVPLDHDDPAGARTSVYVSRVPATGDRIGPLFFNPGGPGASPTSYLPGLAVQFPKAITEHFDLVAVEPRGLPGSGPIDCGMPVEELYRLDPTIDSEADREALLATSAAYTAGCGREVGLDRLSRLGTRTVARDLDVVRAAMGDRQLSFVGVSYGTALGQVYGQLFPDRVRALVLDGVVELGRPGVEDARLQALGFQLALGRWADACRADDACPLRDDPLGAVDDVIAAAEQGDGIRADGAGRRAGPSEVNLALGQGLYSPSAWDQLASAVANAQAGDGTGIVAMADAYLAGSDFDVYFAVTCIDTAWPANAEELLAAATEAGRAAPVFGEAVTSDYVRCSTWPVPADPLEASPLPGMPTVVVVSTTGDPATPYEAGVRLADQLEDAVLLTVDGDGHGAVGNGSPCIDDAISRYLVDGQAPADGLTCTSA
ncbi:MAG: alpha/beta hydrolase [Actinomycetota bacterium]|nr:alpha/beta hydrolase [Actinomycetota bacterium]